MHARTARFAAFVLAIALVAAGCSSDDSNGDKAAPRRSSTTATTTSTSQGSTPTAGAGQPVASAGCRSKAATPAVLGQRRPLQVKGQERWYLLSTPVAEPAKPLPLVLDFHGLAEGAATHKMMSRFGELGQQE